MCKSIKQLSKTKCGELSFCMSSRSFHLIFNNLFFALTKKELITLKTYIDGLEIEYWENKYTCISVQRKIPIVSHQKNLIMMFNRFEIRELRQLLSLDSNQKRNEIALINFSDIDYKIHKN